MVTVFSKLAMVASRLSSPAGAGLPLVVGWQDDQIRHPFLEREHLVGGVGELAAAADAWELPALQQVSSVGEIADQQQRRPCLAADEQRQRPWRVPGGREQDQRTVAHDVQRPGERRQGRVGGWFEADLVPPQSRELDVGAQEAAGLMRQLGQLRPLGRGDQQVGAAQLGESAHVVLVQVGEDRGVDIGRCVAERGELGGECLLRADVESGQAIVEDAGEAAGEVGVVGDRGAVLSGVEQQQPVCVLDDIDVDRPGRQPSPRGQQPPVEGLAGAEGVLGVDLDGPGAADRHRIDRVWCADLRFGDGGCSTEHFWLLI
jgi:hypothetical protein